MTSFQRLRRAFVVFLVILAVIGAVLLAVPDTASAVPITPTITSCTAPNVTFFADRICVDPTTGVGGLVSVFTNNQLVAWSSLSPVNTVFGCSAVNVWSAAWYPFRNPSPAVVHGTDLVPGAPSLMLTTSPNLSCSGFTNLNVYVVTASMLSFIISRPNHTLIAVA